MFESTDPKLPSLADKLLWFLPDHLREEIEGDLLQRYHRDIRKYGPRMAKVRSTWNTVRFLRPAILFRKNNRQRSFPSTMFKNYFVIAFRNMMAHKVNSGINTLSLVIGITSALITLSVIRYELSFDQFHSDADRIYRVNRLTRTDAGDLLQSGLPGPAVAVLREKVTAISNIAGVQYYGPVQIDFEQ